MLNTVVYESDPDTTPVIIAHGLFGSARNWGAIAKRMSATRTVIAADMRNHGDSPWFDTHTYDEMAADLAKLSPGQSDVLGHSMGGKASMMMALLFPDRVRKLVVADIAPVGYRHTQMSMIDAMQTLDLSLVETRSDADHQMQSVVSAPGIRAFLLQSLDVKNRRWRLNLEVLRDQMGQIMGFPQTRAQFDGPAFFLSGAESDYVSAAHRENIKNLFPQAQFAKLNGAGHWLHADKPREFQAAVEAFLSG
ncbi:MAG: alpha/beta fold hydrolase [Boseongicola sp.]